MVFIHATPETLINRCCNDTDPEGVRPLAQDRDAFLRLYEQRLPLYRAADFTVSSDGKRAAEVAREIAVAMGNACRP